MRTRVTGNVKIFELFLMVGNFRTIKYGAVNAKEKELIVL